MLFFTEPVCDNQNLPVIGNASHVDNVTAKSAIGKNVTYACNPLFTHTNGTTDAECLSNRTWQAPTIVCSEYALFT